MNILILNYTNKHITFNKGEYVGHLEPIIEEIPQSTEIPDALKMQSIITERMPVEIEEIIQTVESPDAVTTHSITTEKLTSEKSRTVHFQTTQL